jgi:hypothetical protein
MFRRTLAVLPGLLAALALLPVPQTLQAQSAPLRTRHVVLIVTDGLRWQEVVTGAEAALISAHPGGVPDTAALSHDFWRDTPEARRQALFPFLWGTVAASGQIYGDTATGSIAHTTNPLKFSYPGYNEIFTGVYDPAITSNDHKPNDNVTVFEWLNGRPGLRGHVEAIATWAAFRRIFNRDRAGFPVHDGWDPPFASAARPTVRQQAIDDFYLTATRVWEDNSLDAPMHLAAKEILRRDRPRLLFIGYGETDEWAHLGRYDLVLRSAHQVDADIADLWRTVQSTPGMRGTTTFIITTDHGRGDGPEDWKRHGKDVTGAERLWMAVLGPDTPAHGNHVRKGEVTQAQLAATVAAFFGEDWRTQRPEAGAPIDEMLGRTRR